MGINREMRGDHLTLTNPQSGESVVIREIITGKDARIEPAGRLTMDMTNDLEDELTAMALTCRRLEINMQSVEYIANSVIRMMLEVQHMVDDRDGEMLLTGVGPSIYATFEEMGVEDVLDIRADVPA